MSASRRSRSRGNWRREVDEVERQINCFGIVAFQGDVNIMENVLSRNGLGSLWIIRCQNESCLPWFQRRFIRRGAMAWREGREERSEGEEKSPLVESVGNLTSMLSPRTEIKPRRWLVTNFGCRRILVFFLFHESKKLAICTCISSSKSAAAWPSRLKFLEHVVRTFADWKVSANFDYFCQ